VVTIVSMTWTIYGALIAGFLALAGAAAFLVVRLLQAWRAFKRLRRHLGKELDRLGTLMEQTAGSVARASDQTKLEHSLARLRLALARLALLRGAVDEASATFGRFTALYPRK
jgi:hypothetical protein